MIRRAAVAVLVLLLLALQWRLWIADGGIAHTHRLKQEAARLASENEQLRARNATLDAEVRDLGSGVDAIEARARTTLGMVKAGETFYLVVNP
ncbi:cell division protein FtsB [Fontimonas thermophila]|uniref:Cell division protein FtsB n=1 Tax=Fontimonas thermophila TaxID=1076937 RepID=A0A1I2HIY0_9GAMM|nr:septum formation initiator family protein [Fontimonas thermophila]SFF30255.1 cell division protein FtsB [Fontimonas thermophila]